MFIGDLNPNYRELTGRLSLPSPESQLPASGDTEMWGKMRVATHPHSHVSKSLVLNHIGGMQRPVTTKMAAVKKGRVAQDGSVRKAECTKMPSHQEENGTKMPASGSRVEPSVPKHLGL
ncbi:hypothetical protein GWK47_029683 [Chionoecetes opilio]|uniref:Uncharacterized protein n=1 Tax=Chionoecetes opilio TaxID=41210 RepID=A0A8J4YXX4_CHIOP|nr:hypothetical protein GWK47_029683 [Chionoecetes opilio]